MTIAQTTLLLSLLALIVTKIADIVTTVRGLRRSGIAGERNPLARRAMERWAVGGGIGMIMVLWGVVVAVCYGPAFFAPEWYQWATAAGGFLIAWAQWDVARYNASRRHSWFTRLATVFFTRFRQP